MRYKIKIFGEMTMFNSGSINDDEHEMIKDLIESGGSLESIYQDEEIIEENKLTGIYDSVNNLFQDDLISDIKKIEIYNAESNELVSVVNSIEANEDRYDDVTISDDSQFILFFDARYNGVVFEGEFESENTFDIDLLTFAAMELFTGEENYYHGDFLRKIYYNNQEVPKLDDSLTLNYISGCLLIDGEECDF
jgi:hypothetical protein